MNHENHEVEREQYHEKHHGEGHGTLRQMYKRGINIYLFIGFNHFHNWEKDFSGEIQMRIFFQNQGVID